MSRDLLHAPVAKIDAKTRSMHRTVFVDAALLFGTLASTFITSGNTIAATAAVAAAAIILNHYKDQNAKQDDVKELPGYFYWGVTRRSRK